MKFEKDIEDILKVHSLAHVATTDTNGNPNVSLKGIVDYDSENGVLCFLDLFCNHTRKNLKENTKIAVTLVDYDNFKGYQFKGVAETVDSGDEYDKCVQTWHFQKHSRYRERLDWNFSKIMKPGKSEIDLPSPKYLVKVKVQEIINLAPF
jgi:predicted pyridoxine 5'-phosphate oxidase superfamily flavin-nucleotide-binding protein